MKQDIKTKETFYFQFIEGETAEICHGHGEYEYARVYGRKHKLTWQELHCKKANLEEVIEELKRDKLVYICGEDRRKKVNGRKVRLVRKITTTITEEEEL